MHISYIHIYNKRYCTFLNELCIYPIFAFGTFLFRGKGTPPPYTEPTHQVYLLK